MTTINTKTELISTLRDSNRRVTEWFMEIPVDTFCTRQDEVWSASDNLDQVIKAHNPITKALRLPKITLQAIFGKPEKSSMSYQELCQNYRDQIAKDAKQLI